MYYPLSKVAWDDFPALLRQARDEIRHDGTEEPRKSCLPAREKLFAPVEKSFRQWIQRNYGHDAWVFDPRGSDVFQQVYLCAWKGFERFKGNTEKEFLAWILKILNNELNQIFRKGRQERGFFSELGSAAYAEEPIENLNLLEQLIVREEQAMAREAFEQLPQEYREILVLRYENRLGYEEIGARMHRSTDAARMLCTRARVMLYHLVCREAGEDK